MSRKGSMTTPTPRSVSATTKLVFPSSGAGTASTVYKALVEERCGRQQDPERYQSHDPGAAVKDHLRRHAFGRAHSDVDQEIAQPVGVVEEREREQDEEVELDQRVAQHVDPRVVMPVDHRGVAERPEDALDEHVDRQQESGQHAALREEEPPEQVRKRGSPPDIGAHRANQTRTNATTTEATSHIPNMASTIRRDGTGRSKTLKWRIVPARLRNVTLWYSENRRTMTLNAMNAGEPCGRYWEAGPPAR